MNSFEDENILSLLESYIYKLKNSTLTVEERLNLIEFFVNDPNNVVKNKYTDTITNSQMQQFLTIGWMFSLVMNNEI